MISRRARLPQEEYGLRCRPKLHCCNVPPPSFLDSKTSLAIGPGKWIFFYRPVSVVICAQPAPVQYLTPISATLSRAVFFFSCSPQYSMLSLAPPPPGAREREREREALPALMPRAGTIESMCCSGFPTPNDHKIGPVARHSFNSSHQDQTLTVPGTFLHPSAERPNTQLPCSL